jgi:hypothetical protein
LSWYHHCRIDLGHSYQFKLAVFELKFKILLTFSFLFDIYCVVCVAEPLYTYWSFSLIVHMSFIWWFMLHFLQIRLLQETNYRSNWSLLIFLFIIIQLFILKCDKKKKTRNKINCLSFFPKMWVLFSMIVSECKFKYDKYCRFWFKRGCQILYIYIYSSFFYVGAKIVVFAMKHMLS